MERLWLLVERMGIAMQPVIPLYMFADSDEELVELAGERRLQEMREQSELFREVWNLGATEAPSMIFRFFDAEPPSVHSIRMPLDQSVSRRYDVSGVDFGYQTQRN